MQYDELARQAGLAMLDLCDRDIVGAEKFSRVQLVLRSLMFR